MIATEDHAEAPPTEEDGDGAEAIGRRISAAVSKRVKAAAPPAGPNEDTAEVDDIAQRIAASINAPHLSLLEKATVGAAEALGSMAEAPDLLVKGLGHFIPRETLLQQIPNIAAGAEWLAKQGRDIRETMQSIAPVGARGESFGAQLPYMLGGLVPTVALSAVGGEAAPLVGMSEKAGQVLSVAATGAAQVAAPMYHDVLAATVDREHPNGDETKALTAAALGMGIGATQAIGVGTILAKLQRASGGGVSRYLTAVALGALEQGGQQGLQQGLQDAAETHLTGRDMELVDRLDRAGKAGLFGLLFGGIVSAGAHAGARGKVRERAVANIGPETAPPGSAQETGSAPMGGGSTEGPIVAPGAPHGPEGAAAGAVGEPGGTVNRESRGQSSHELVQTESQPSAAQSPEAGAQPAAPAQAEVYAHTDEPAANSSVQPGDKLGPVQAVPIGELREFNPKKRPEAAKVAEIRGAMERGEPLPPVIASRDETGNLVIDDGSHRIAAARELGFEAVPVRVLESGEPTKLAAKSPESPEGSSAAQAQPRMRTADVVDAMRRLVREYDPDLPEEEQDLTGAVQHASMVLEQRRAAKLEPTELDETLGDLVHMSQVPPAEEFGGKKERAQTDYSIAAIKTAKAMLDVFDASRESALHERRVREQPPPPSRTLTPEEEASDRILRGEHLSVEEIEKTPKAIKRASLRAQRGEKARARQEVAPREAIADEVRRRVRETLSGTDNPTGYIPPQFRIGQGKNEHLVNMAEIIRGMPDVELVPGEVNRYRLKQTQPSPPSVVRESATPAGQPAPTEATEKPIGVATTEGGPIEPWQMTRAQWQAAYDAQRAETFGSSPAKASATGEVARIEERSRLRYGAESSVDPDSDFYGPVTHRRVIEKALAEGKPVPAAVLADYPDLKVDTPGETQPPAREAATTTEPVKVEGATEEVPKEIREFHAFPGGALDPVLRQAGKLIQRFRRTPPLQAGAAPMPTARWTEKAVQRYADYFEPVARVARALAGERRPGEANLPDLEDAYLQETVRRGKTLHGARGLLWLEREHQKPMLQTMRAKRISMDELDEFLMARNAHTGNELIRTRNPDSPDLTRYGMTDEEADAILTRVKADPRAAAFEELGAKFDQLNRDTLARHVASGRMTEEQAAALQKAQPHYAPARTDMSGPDGEPAQVPSGKKRVGQPFKKALGRESRAESPLAFAFAQAEQAIVQGEINGTRLAFLRMARAYQAQLGDALKIVAVPMQRVLVNGEVRESFDPFWRGRNDVVVAWENGKPIGMEIAPEHADLAKALNQLGPDQIQGATKLASAFNRMRSALITRYRPFFWPSNMIRDVKSAAYLGSEFGIRHAARVVADVPRAFATLAGKQTELTPLVQRYKEAGGPITFLELSNLSTQLDKMQAALAEPKTSSGDQTLEGFRRIKEAMNSASDLGENATRFSAFAHLVEDLGWSDARAAAYAKEMQNFERKGTNGNAVNAWYMFANAGVQASRRFAQALRHPAVRATLAASFLGAMGWDQLQRTIGGKAPDDEDWWDKIPDYEKQGNFIFMYPDGSGRRVTIPAPFVFGAVNYTGQQLGALLSGNIGAGKFISSSAEAWVNALNPLGSMSGSDGQGAFRALTPDIARLPLEIATNRDWRGKAIYQEHDKGPDSWHSWPDANPQAKAIAQWLNSTTGGDKYQAGAIDVAPETLEHVADFFGSGLPQDVAALGRLAQKQSAGEPITTRDVPLLKRFVREPSPFASWQEQEDLLDSLKAEQKRAEDEKRGLSREAMTTIHLGDEVQRERSKVQHPKKGSAATPLDAMDERAKQLELQKLDLAAQTWNRRARESLKKITQGRP